MLLWRILLRSAAVLICQKCYTACYVVLQGLYHMVLTQTKAAYTHESAPSKCTWYLVVQYWDERWRRNGWQICESKSTSTRVSKTHSQLIYRPTLDLKAEGGHVVCAGDYPRHDQSGHHESDTYIWYASHHHETRTAGSKDFNEVKRRLLAFLQE